MAYWLFKTEPGAWSWDDQVKTGTEHWDRVRNYQANNNMKAMKVGDQGFFYHSVNEKQVVGIVEIVREHYPDHTDDSQRFGMVDIKTVMPVKTPVTLADCKSNPKLEKMTLVNNSRLSVQPVTPTEWKEVCRMAGVKA
ncbi:MAG: EVE domain-containing protein [Alphaproteobacteria bacterium]|jgi:predicted RNA-binding protein with PUA-like domain